MKEPKPIDRLLLVLAVFNFGAGLIYIAQRDFTFAWFSFAASAMSSGVYR